MYLGFPIPCTCPTKKYGEAEALLRDNKEAFISLYGDFDFAYGITFTRMLKYSNEKENILLEGISDEIKIVLSKYITENSSISHYFADWGNYLYFCTLCGSKSDTIIDLCSKANDIYVADCTKDNFEKYLYISKISGSIIIIKLNGIKLMRLLIK